MMIAAMKRFTTESARARSLLPSGHATADHVAVRATGNIIQSRRRHSVVMAGLHGIAQLLVGVSKIQIERRVELTHAIVRDRVGSPHSLLVPVKRRLGVWLVACHVVSGHASVKIVRTRLPCLLEEEARIVPTPFGLCLHSLYAEFDHGVVWVHTFALSRPAYTKVIARQVMPECCHESQNEEQNGQHRRVDA